jgi:antitoxin component YwqK of YwqJK toxin-antitoxin module
MEKNYRKESLVFALFNVTDIYYLSQNNKSNYSESVMKKRSVIVALGIMALLISCRHKNDDFIYEYYPDGTLKSEIQVRNGLRNGITKNYDERGRLASTAELADDKYEGWMINYNPKNNKVTAKALYKNDQQNGPATLYYSDGQLYREMTYVDGRVDSIVKTYWPGDKLQAEVYFEMGQPAVGLKEFDKNGTPVKQPAIMVKEVDLLSLFNKIELKIFLSDNTKEVEFYKGELKEGKYLYAKTPVIYSRDGIATLYYTVPKGRAIRDKISIISRSRTENGNTLVLQRVYNLSVSN